MTLDAPGAATFAATTRQAANRLRRLDLDQVGDLLLSEVDPPVDTGRLQTSLYVRTADDEVILATDLRYAPYVRPFAEQLLDQRQEQIVDRIIDAVDDAVAVLQGA